MQLLSEANHGIQQIPRPITALAIYGKAQLLAAQHATQKSEIDFHIQNAEQAAALLRARTDRRPVDTQSLQELQRLISAMRSQQ